jgi:hypothetical protein
VVAAVETAQLDRFVVRRPVRNEHQPVGHDAQRTDGDARFEAQRRPPGARLGIRGLARGLQGGSSPAWNERLWVVRRGGSFDLALGDLVRGEREPASGHRRREGERRLVVAVGVPAQCEGEQDRACRSRDQPDEKQECQVEPPDTGRDGSDREREIGAWWVSRSAGQQDAAGGAGRGRLVRSLVRRQWR